MPQVISIQRCDQLAACLANPEVSRRRNAGFLCSKYADTVVASGGRFNKCCGLVGRAIVDYNHLNGVIGLRQSGC